MFKINERFNYLRQTVRNENWLKRNTTRLNTTQHYKIIKSVKVSKQLGQVVKRLLSWLFLKLLSFSAAVVDMNKISLNFLNVGNIDPSAVNIEKQSIFPMK